MPDWVSHILFALIIVEVFSLNHKSLVVVGAVLPDMLLKLVHLRIFFSGIPAEELYRLFFPLHTILGCLLVAIIIAPLFKEKMKVVVSLLMVGVVSHILLDGLAKVHILNVQGFLLYPLKSINWSLNVVRMENFFIPMIVLALVFVLVKFAKYVVRKNFI